ncbi:glycerophosphoryl diester phosphodiesterase [Lachnospiraceae bacterium XBD2001]|nr:glycerophosphoryl diester phosphodiesterase [Lachnospiraceae bacterium XBD2001]
MKRIRNSYQKFIPTIMRYQIPTKAVLCLLLGVPISGVPALSFFVLLMLVLVLLDLRAIRIMTRELLYPSNRDVLELAREVLDIFRPKKSRFNLRNAGLILLAGIMAVIMAAILFANGIHLPAPIRVFVYKRTRNLLIFLGVVLVIFLITFYHMMLLQMKSHVRGVITYRQMLRYFLPKYLGYVGGYWFILIMSVVIPTVIIGQWNLASGVMRFLNILIFVIGLGNVIVATLVLVPFLYLELNGIIHHLEVVAGNPAIMEWDYKKSRRYPRHVTMRIIASFALLIALLTTILYNFGHLFPEKEDALVISHRGGGIMAGENTLAGLEEAISLGAGGSEIDIQRTRDGHYIVNHDRTFQRVAGINRTAQDMTLEEVKHLRVLGPDGKMYPVATFEEMLQASKGRIHLFIELKGSSANRKMVRDVVRMIEDYDMVEECSIISMNYNMVEYAEETYPTIDTGYVCYFSYGNVAALDCDFLVLQDKGATASTVILSQLANKKTYIWTINDKRSMHYYLNGIADGIITDRPKKALSIYEELNK